MSQHRVAAVDEELDFRVEPAAGLAARAAVDDHHGRDRLAALAPLGRYRTPGTVQTVEALEARDGRLDQIRLANGGVQGRRQPARLSGRHVGHEDVRRRSVGADREGDQSLLAVEAHAAQIAGRHVPERSGRPVVWSAIVSCVEASALIPCTR